MSKGDLTIFTCGRASERPGGTGKKFKCKWCGEKFTSTRELGEHAPFCAPKKPWNPEEAGRAGSEAVATRPTCTCAESEVCVIHEGGE